MIKQITDRRIDFSNLPKTKGGRIDWKHSEGCVIPFKYDDIISQCVINRVMQNRKLEISIENYTNSYIIYNNDLYKCNLGYVLKKFSTDFLFNIGDIVNNNLLITDRYRKDGCRMYNYICINDGYVGSIPEDRIKLGKGCPACCGKVVIRGKTDISTTHPDIASLFWDKEDTYKYSAFSGAKADFRCPVCGEKINSIIYNVTLRGLSCKKCGDGVSYPEKFVFNVLDQVFKLHKDAFKDYTFNAQKKFDWSKNIQHDNQKLSGDKIYDFYIQFHNDLIIETHGPQHFERGFNGSSKRTRTLEEEQENDCIKYNIAIQNGISSENYIVLDCRRSTVEHIKSSIMSSNLPQILNFTEDQIDWNMCGLFAASSRTIEACKLWNSGIKSMKQIAQEMKMSQRTISRYLRRGEELGIVQDPPKHRKKKTQQND